jgi:hypothetical protein
MLTISQICVTNNLFRKGRGNESIIMAERGSDLLLPVPNREGCKADPFRNRRKGQG